MSPEQIIADKRGLDARSDIYSVGLILYELLTGYRAFDGRILKLIYDHVHTPPPPFAEKNPDIRVPPEVERLVLRCLEKDPNLRPQSARELAEEFRRTATSMPPHAVVQPPRAWTWRRVAWVVMAVAALAGLIWRAASEATSRTPPPSFTLNSVPTNLSLPAGEERPIIISLRRDRFTGAVPIDCEYGATWHHGQAVVRRGPG